VEHREFWQDLVDWLASGSRDSLLLQLPAAAATVLAPVEVRVYGAGVGEIPDLVLARPDGRLDTLALAGSPAEPGILRAAFLPEHAGDYTLGFADEPVSTGLRVSGDRGVGADVSSLVGSAADLSAAAAVAEDRWARLAFLVDRSGGALVPADSLEDWVARWQAAQPTGKADRGWLATLLFALIILAALTEWMVRRLRGFA
jgi:hypothetical protein